MNELVHIILFCAAFAPVCIFIHVVLTWEGMLLYKQGNAAEALLPGWLAKPLFTCPTCMASVWGTTFWFMSGGGLSIWWPVACMALSGVNTLVSALLYMEKSEKSP